MSKQLSALFSVLVRTLTALTTTVLASVIYFIVEEALPALDEVVAPDSLSSRRWMLIAYTGEPSFDIFNFIATMLYVSLVAMVLAVTVRLGAAIYLPHVVTERMRGVLYPFVNLLAGIPSVIYGFMGLTLTVKLFIRVGVHTGSCVFITGVLLAVMLLPFLISFYNEVMLRIGKRYQPAVDTLGISKWRMAVTIVLPRSWKDILLSMILTIRRAMEETTVVIMVIGNASLSSSLPGKGKNIASVITLEMGTAVVGSTHYHTLHAAGLVLIFLLFFVDFGITPLHGKLE